MISELFKNREVLRTLVAKDFKSSGAASSEGDGK